MISSALARPGARIAAALYIALTTGCAESAAPEAAAAPAPAAHDGALPPQAPIHFTDVTAESGIDFVMTSGSAPSTQILEVKGGGLALIDFDNDGDLDLFVPNGATLDHPDHGPGCRLYENLGGLKFRDVTAASGLEFHRWGMGVAVGDIDGDGLDDLFIACFGGNALLRNLGGGRFAEITAKAGLGDDRGPQSPSGRDRGAPRWSAGAAFGDIDNDGDLDLYVANYLQFDPANLPPGTTFLGNQVFAGPQGLIPQPDFLYENLGDGTFRDISESSGILSVPPAFGLGVVMLDFDGDGLQDIFVGNDSMKKNLFHNLGSNRFADVASDAGIATNAEGSEQATMGIAIGDVDGNGRPDVFTTNFSDDTNTLHLNLDGRFFDDRTQQYGLGVVSRPFLGWATMFYDLDLDGDEDLLIFNGHVYPQATRQTMNSDYRQVPLLLERDGSRFKRVTGSDSGSWLNEAHCNRSAVFGDLDNDGDVDVIVAELNGPVRILRNDAVGRTKGHWLIVELTDARKGIGNRHGLGAKIGLIDSSGATQSRWIFSGGSFQSACATYAHFGLSRGGPVTLDITWPGGTRQRLENVKIDQHLIVPRP